METQEKLPLSHILSNSSNVIKSRMDMSIIRQMCGPIITKQNIAKHAIVMRTFRQVTEWNK